MQTATTVSVVNDFAATRRLQFSAPAALDTNQVSPRAHCPTDPVLRPLYAPGGALLAWWDEGLVCRTCRWFSRSQAACAAQ